LNPDRNYLDASPNLYTNYLLFSFSNRS